jgi:DNA-directed RNA polymerase specialized sigma24 family protein
MTPSSAEARTPRSAFVNSPRLLSSQSPRDIEAILLENYTWLLDWAHQLTHGTSEESEDLVQDLCVRLMRMKTKPDLPDDDQARAYLYKALRNLFLSKRLRHGHDAVAGLLVVDFDSVAWAMSAVDRSKLLYVRSDLARICEYACIRRKSSRAAAALILRFFFGYLPTEAMAILKAKRAGIDTLTQTARLEAKAYLERPSVLRFLERSEKKTRPVTQSLPEESDALFAELLSRIFDEPEGSCFPPGYLEERYQDSPQNTFSTDEIAHLVSCRTCLHTATKILALPDLTLQFLPDLSSSGEAGPPTAGSEKTNLKKLHRKLRETYEHRPSKLQIIVDGVVRGVQTIAGASSKVQIALQPLSKPGFVEILSEQGLGLLYLDLQPDETGLPNTQQAEVELSDGRQLSVSLTWNEGVPVVHVSYYDPLFESEGDGPPSGTAESNEALVSASPLIRKHYLGGRDVHGWLDRLRHRLRGWWRLIGTFAVIACGTIFALLGYLHEPRSKTPPPSAAALLSRSDEKLSASTPAHGAVRSRFSLEVTGSNGHPTSHLEVEALRSADRPLRVVRLHAQNGTVLAAQKVDAAGKESNFSSHRAQSSSGADLKTLSADGIWQYAPDAKSFEDLAAGANNMSVIEVQGGYDVGFRRAAMADRPTIVEATLHIASDSLRPVAETLELQEGDARREYRFREVAYEVLPASEVREADFWPISISGTRHVLTPPDANSRTDTAELVLEILESLSRQRQEVQDSVDVEREKDGTVAVSGVLSSSSQKQVLLRTLQSLQGAHALSVELHSPDDPQPITASAARTLTVGDPVSIADGRLPLDHLLREPLRAKGLAGSELDTRIRESAAALVEAGAKLHREAWVADQIATKDFRAEELQAMRPDKRGRWLALIRLHLDACASHVNAIVGTIATSRHSDVAIGTAAQPSDTDVEFRAGFTSFVRATTELDSSLASGFALSPESQSPSVTPAELEELLNNLQAEESRLEATLDRLHKANPQSRKT